MIMKHLSIALIAISFFALVFGVAYITKTPWALLALLLMPEVKLSTK